MRITHGAIYLAQPVFGRHCLTGAATIGTTWLDYTFSEGSEDLVLPPDSDPSVTPPRGWRVLIPITNVTAVVVGPAEPDHDAGIDIP